MHKIRLPCRVLMEGQPTVLDLNETLLRSKTTQFLSSSTSSSSRRSAEPRWAFTSWSAPASIGSSKPHKGSEFVVFTAGLEESESMMLDRLDCAGAISHLLYRQSCRVTDGKFVKDLSELGRDLGWMMIVDDNHPNADSLHPENALPVAPWAPACAAVPRVRRQVWRLEGLHITVSSPGIEM